MNIGYEKGLTSIYEVECFDSEGNLRWSDVFHNIVVEEGVDDSLDKHFKGSGYTAAWYVGITSATPTFAYADTMSSHAGWEEASPLWADTARPTLILGTVGGGSVSNSASKATFSIVADGTAGGAFVTTGSARGSADGILYGGGSFTSGNRSLLNGDTLNITVTLSAASTTA